MGRAPCCARAGLKKGRWTAEEDQLLIIYVQEHGEGSWRSVPKNAGLKRCGKSCRLRWINYLRTDLKRGNITPEEEDVIIRLHASLGNRWSMIAGNLPGRTDNEIKNYWNSHLSRKVDRFIKLQNGAPSTFMNNNKSMTIENQTGHSIPHSKPLVNAYASAEKETTMLPIAITSEDGIRDSNIYEGKLEENSSMEVQVSDTYHAMGHCNTDPNEIMRTNVEKTRVDELKARMEEPFGNLKAEQVSQSNLLDCKIRDFSDIVNIEIQRGNGIAGPTQVTATNKGRDCSEWSCRNAESEDWVDLAWKSILQSHKLWDEEISWLWDSDTIDGYQI